MERLRAPVRDQRLRAGAHVPARAARDARGRARAGSSTSARWAASSSSPAAAPTTRPSTRSRRSPTRCASRSRASASTSSMIEPGLITTKFGETAAGSLAEPAERRAAPTTRTREFNAAVGAATVGVYEGPMARLGGGPETVARAIERAISPARPKTRYKVTASARLALGQRRAAHRPRLGRVHAQPVPEPQEPSEAATHRLARVTARRSRRARDRSLAIAPLAAIAAAVRRLGGADRDADHGRARSGADSLDPALALDRRRRSKRSGSSYTPLLTYRHAEGETGAELIAGLASDLPEISDGRAHLVAARCATDSSTPTGARSRASDFERAIARVLYLELAGRAALRGDRRRDAPTSRRATRTPTSPGSRPTTRPARSRSSSPAPTPYFAERARARLRRPAAGRHAVPRPQRRPAAGRRAVRDRRARSATARFVLARSRGFPTSTSPTSRPATSPRSRPRSCPSAARSGAGRARRQARLHAGSPPPRRSSRRSSSRPRDRFTRAPDRARPSTSSSTSDRRAVRRSPRPRGGQRGDRPARARRSTHGEHRPAARCSPPASRATTSASTRPTAPTATRPRPPDRGGARGADPPGRRASGRPSGRRRAPQPRARPGARPASSTRSASSARVVDGSAGADRACIRSLPNPSPRPRSASCARSAGRPLRGHRSRADRLATGADASIATPTSCARSTVLVSPPQSYVAVLRPSARDDLPLGAHRPETAILQPGLRERTTRAGSSRQGE